MPSPPLARPRVVAGASGEVFLIEYLPAAVPRGTVLHVPAFAEEMNRVRRMVALQARALATQGFRVLVPDLYGTGDSEGDFADARWSGWLDDLDAVLAQSTDAAGDRASVEPPLWLWGVRTGALLALDFLATRDTPVAGVIAWSPVTDGKAFMNQFIRLRLLASMIAGARDRESIGDLRERLARDGTLEVAGYELSTALVEAMDGARLADLAAASPELAIHWFELTAAPDAPVPPAARRAAATLSEQGAAVALETVAGPAFHSTPEITTAPALVDATTAAVCDG